MNLEEEAYKAAVESIALDVAESEKAYAKAKIKATKDLEEAFRLL